MLATIVTVHGGRTQVHQIEAPTVKDCLVAWAGRVAVEGLDDPGRTRLRGDMADFDRPPLAGFASAWKFETDLGLGGDPSGTVVVVETPRRP